jgi:hypothetical protein
MGFKIATAFVGVTILWIVVLTATDKNQSGNFTIEKSAPK